MIMKRNRLQARLLALPYVQLANLLRERIRPGEYPPGRAIPSVERIRQETGLAVKTIRRATRVLEDEGLVVIRPGWGTFVAKGAAGWLGRKRARNRSAFRSSCASPASPQSMAPRWDKMQG